VDCGWEALMMKEKEDIRRCKKKRNQTQRIEAIRNEFLFHPIQFAFRLMFC